MFPYNEYQVHEHRKELLRSAEQARLVQQSLVDNRLTERFGRALLGLGAWFAVKDECQTIQTSGGQAVTVCPA